MEKVEVKIIHEEDGFMVLDKPAGMVTTNENSKLKTQNFEQISLENWVKRNRENNLPREGIVHRLDKGTSGLVLVAKNEQWLVKLKEQFKKRLLKKSYLAMVGGDTSFSGRLDMPIARSRYTFGRFRVDEFGKMASTEFRRIKKFKIENKIFSLVEINLLTGRTHQIRVHFTHLGWPLLGDRTYGGAIVPGLSRPFLHACRIEVFGQKFMSDIPEDLRKILEEHEEV